MHGRVVMGAAVALVAASLLTTGPVVAAGAPGDRTTAVCSSPAPEVSGVLKGWDAGPTSHIRGWTATYQSTGDALCAGTVEVVASIEMDPGIGGLQGTFVYRLAGIEGGWSGTFTQVWAFDKGQLTYGREVAKGFGALEGWQLRGVLNELFDGTIVETDEVFVPGR